MHELIASGLTLPEAYHNALYSLYNHNDVVPCPDYSTEQIEAAMTMVVKFPLMEPRISKLFTGDPRSLEQYRQEILYGILDFEVERGNWEYTYHERLAPHIPWLVQELERNPYSRRAVITTFREKDLESESPPCLVSMHFFIRNGMLELKVTLRSNDAPKAAFMNAFAFICLQQIVAVALGIPVGQYVQRSESYHVYKKDYNTFNAYIGAIRNGTVEDLSYNYEGDWKDMMEDEKKAIKEMVRQQREKYEALELIFRPKITILEKEEEV